MQLCIYMFSISVIAHICEVLFSYKQIRTLKKHQCVKVLSSLREGNLAAFF